MESPHKTTGLIRIPASNKHGAWKAVFYRHDGSSWEPVSPQSGCSIIVPEDAEYFAVSMSLSVTDKRRARRNRNFRFETKLERVLRKIRK